ncbi:MAG: peptidoglycan/xylan/chitin deacetylase (PgdA/CDA1 family) [Rhodothermales bacterium]|jgi:peptidoglycan/xylan/chitin deacetylase (PgdA/CDA1 family)
MRRHLLVLVLSLVCAACARPTEPRRIAITLDDAPVAKPLSYASDWERRVAVDSLTATLTRFGVPATVFAIGSELSDPSVASLLNVWAAAGLSVANHSVSHQSFNQLSHADGVREMAQGQAIISRLVAPVSISRYFRFPFLEEGATIQARDRWMASLDSLALRSAPVSITTDDWRFDNRYMAAEEAGNWELRYEIGQEYLAHVKESIRHWDGLAVELYDRNVRHVLMLHANRINRDYLSQILEWLQGEGFGFITIDEAYQDDLYMEPTTWRGDSGVSLLESIKQSRISRGAYGA